MTKARVSLFCNVDGCERQVIARELCGKHYHRWQRYGDPLRGGTEQVQGVGDTPEEKFWSRIDKNGPISKKPGTRCWIWLGFIDTTRGRDEYGTVWIDKRHWATHRYAYFLHYGVDPGELRVCHHCDNPPCCNPEHLFLGTDGDNVRDKFAKGRGGIGDTHWTKHKPERIARGENQHSAKMTADKVREMRRIWDAKEMNSYELGEKFGIRQSSAHKICTRNSWKHVE